MPSEKPLNTALPPFSRPYNTCFGFFIFSLSLLYSNYLSKVKAASPEAIVPVTFSTELRAPPTEWAINEEVP